MDIDTSYKSVEFYIIESAKIKSELAKHETEYHPEKVRELINSYKYSINKVIEHGEIYLSQDDKDEAKAKKVFYLVGAYRKLLSSISNNE